MLHLRSLAPFISAVLLVNAGCTSSNGLVPVGGKVTYKNQAVAGATILFMGDDKSPPATALSGQDGTYSLSTLDSDGIKPGNYSVVVMKTDQPLNEAPPSMEESATMISRPAPVVKQLLPAKYGDATRTPLKFEVKPGPPATFDLELQD